MKIRVLGCGGSFGSPLAWGRNGNIDINNLNNFRTRSSILIYVNNTNILIDQARRAGEWLKSRNLIEIQKTEDIKIYIENSLRLTFINIIKR